MSLIDNENVFFCVLLFRFRLQLYDNSYLNIFSVFLCAHIWSTDFYCFNKLSLFGKIKIILISFSQKPVHQLGSNYAEIVFDPTFSDSSVLPCLRCQHQQWPCNNTEHHIWPSFRLFQSHIYSLHIRFICWCFYSDVTVTHSNAPR